MKLTGSHYSGLRPDATTRFRVAYIMRKLRRREKRQKDEECKLKKAA